MRVDIWHNILWSRYKGVVFGALVKLAAVKGTKVRIYQIAETSRERLALGAVDLSYHQYPFELIFSGAYDDVPLPKILAALFKRTFFSDADIVVLSGYHRPEHWLQLL